MFTWRAVPFLDAPGAIKCPRLYERDPPVVNDCS